ncbi:MAG TPA: hypothetical protein VFQ60_03385 [Patescibacteria group bacterium]|nr:hypothetical protein [Patescibacteria group bacterium]
MPDDLHIIGSGLTEHQLAAASWWLRHKNFFQKFGYSALIVCAALFWIYTLWTLFDGFILSYARESKIPNHIAQNELDMNTLLSTAPQPVQISDVLTLATTGNRENFVVQITNPNTAWWVEFTYRFSTGGAQTPDREGFALPNSQRYISELGWKGSASNAQLVIDNVRWHRINPADVKGDYAAFFTERDQLQFKDIQYKNDLTIGSETIGQSSFTLSNPSAFGFWSVPITAILYRGSNPVAVSTLEVRNLKPGENRPLTINWFENVLGVSKVELQANVNVLDPSVFLPTSQFGS